MLAIARALVARPKLLLLDDRSLGLAPQVVALIFKIVRTIALKGRRSSWSSRTRIRPASRDDGARARGRAARCLGPAKELAADDSIRKAYLGVH